MISKCANPVCSSVFRYLNEGRLFFFESTGFSEMNTSTDDGEFVGAPHLVRCYWLCSTCCRSMMLVPEGEGMKTVAAENPGCCWTRAA